MELEQILNELRASGGDRPLSREILAEAVRQKDAVTPALLASLDDLYEKIQPEDHEDLFSDPAYSLFNYALFLLAQFREKKAFPKLMRLLTLDEERLDEALGDIITDSMQNILYSTYNGDFDAVKAMVMDNTLYDCARGAALRVLDGLIQDGSLSRTSAEEILREWLAALSSGDNDSLVCTLIVELVMDNDLYGMAEDVREAYQGNKIDLAFFGDFDSFFDGLYNPTANIYRTYIIDDAAKELGKWGLVSGDEKERAEPSFDDLMSWDAGRNDPCPCGSGKKFKKCCLPKQDKLQRTYSREWLIADEYPSATGKDGRPGLLDFYSQEALDVDRLAYQAIHDRIRHFRRMTRKEATKALAESRKFLWRAFEQFQQICVRDGLETPEAYDERYKVHYLCREWLEALHTLLEREGNEQKCGAVQAILDRKEKE